MKHKRVKKKGKDKFRNMEYFGKAENEAEFMKNRKKHNKSKKKKEA